MRRVLAFFVLSFLLTHAFAMAQQPGPGAPNAPGFENGTITNGVYSNECLGFSLPVPIGWDIDKSVTAGGKARRRSDKSLVLLFLRQQGTFDVIILSARTAAGQTASAQEFVSDAVRAQVNVQTEHRELIRDTSAVNFGGKQFFRSDYKVPADGASKPLYMAYIYTKFRGYFIGETIASVSPEGLDEAANSLQAIKFQEDQVNPKCAMGTQDNAPSKENTGSSSTAGASPSTPGSAQPEPVRVDRKVTVGLLIKKVTPDYPPLARQAHIQGTVMLQAHIDKEGNVVDLTLLSGHPMLAPAAIRAVKQWKYKPYLLNGQPVDVETPILVTFSQFP